MAAIFNNLDKISNNFVRDNLKAIKETLEKSQNPIVKVPEEAAQIIDYPDLEFIKEIAAGSFGKVWLGKWLGKWLGTFVAIKKPHRNDEDTADNALRAFNEIYKKSLRDEASIMAKLHHPNVVKLYGIVTQPEFCVVMELMIRGTLYSLLNSTQVLNWPFRYRIGFDVAQGLRYLHRLKILHRDLKSPNILLDNDYRAKLSDYGTSKYGASYSTQSLYSPFWLAPELFLFMVDPQSKATVDYTPACDVYSFAVVLWELASRKEPKYINPHELMAGRRQDIPHDTPPSMHSLITRCWSKKAENRPLMDVVAQEMGSNLINHDSVVAELSPTGAASDTNTSLPSPSTGRAGLSFFVLPRPGTSHEEEPLPEEPDESYPMKAKHNYSAKKPEQLSFAKNDVLTVLNDEGNWWYCELRGERGVVPRNYLVPTPTPTSIPGLSNNRVG